MTIDYEQLKLFVKEAMFTGGGINQPSAPEGVPHRMPAADPSQRDGNAKANELYGIALVRVMCIIFFNHLKYFFECSGAVLALK